MVGVTLLYLKWESRGLFYHFLSKRSATMPPLLSSVICAILKMLESILSGSLNTTFNNLPLNALVSKPRIWKRLSLKVSMCFGNNPTGKNDLALRHECLKHRAENANNLTKGQQVSKQEGKQQVSLSPAPSTGRELILRTRT